MNKWKDENRSIFLANAVDRRNKKHNVLLLYITMKTFFVFILSFIVINMSCGGEKFVFPNNILIIGIKQHEIGVNKNNT